MVKIPFEPWMNMKLIPKYIKVQNDVFNKKLFLFLIYNTFGN